VGDGRQHSGGGVLMQRGKVFISSVQAEFAEERQILFEYLCSDALLGKFFEPFIFERTEAKDQSAQKVYLDQIRMCDIYIGLFGTRYGFEDAEGISPTEREYDLATELYKTRLIYIKNSEARDDKEKTLIKKIEKDVVRKSFTTTDELKAEIYASLIRYLEEKEIIRVSPFDATFNRTAALEDIDEKKVKNFVAKARIKRNFPFDESADYRTVLSHLDLIVNEKITNAAILLFGKKPQRFMITSSVKCCQYYGNRVEKPIPSYHIYDGDVFELIDQAVSFVMSRINAKVGDRDKTILADVEPELPLQAVTEAIVNAVCHRDYTSNASVQVMLFKDRLEIWNPGQLPYGLTVEMLKTRHSSRPANPLLARPMYLYGSIEQVGTGTEMIVEKCIEHGLRTPDFEQDGNFIVTLWRDEGNIDKVGMEREPSSSKKTVEKTVEKIMDIISKKPQVTQTELAEMTGLTRRGIEWNLSKLKAEGQLERIGPDKGGYWEVHGR
jgi:predicted HTH transcriptional regulator